MEETLRRVFDGVSSSIYGYGPDAVSVTSGQEQIVPIDVGIWATTRCCYNTTGSKAPFSIAKNLSILPDMMAARMMV
ncbi:hypothetical protein QYF36_003336 [Acer negundo]|nr:hypothetical protein QYF36_003336 [Acer negundo]